MIFDDRGMPWTIRLSLGWTIVHNRSRSVLCGCPILAFRDLPGVLVRTKQGRSTAFWCYMILTATLILVLLLPL